MKPGQVGSVEQQKESKCKDWGKVTQPRWTDNGSSHSRQGLPHATSRERKKKGSFIEYPRECRTNLRANDAVIFMRGTEVENHENPL